MPETPASLAMLSQLATLSDAYLSDKPELRLTASSNAQRLVAFEQQPVDASTVVRPVFSGAGYRDRARRFSLLILWTDQNAGKGRLLYGVTAPPTANGFGIPLPSGGAYFPITGSENIYTVSVIAETGNTFIASWALFI